MDEQAFVMNPDRWPQRILPVKRRKGLFDDDNYLGIIMRDNLRKVYVQNMFMETTDNTKVEEYPSIEEMLTEWRLD